MTEVLEASVEDRVLFLRLNRPERKNALTRELLAELSRRFRAAAEDDDVWAVVLTGNGDAFCSGLDVSDQSTLGPREPAAETGAGSPPGPREHLAAVMQLVCEKPILAGINGVAVGAGVSLAMNADFRIAASSARFHPGYPRIGLSPDMGLTWTLPRAIGTERTMRFLLEQRMIPASEALQLGMIGEVVERDEDLEARLVEYAAMLASVAPLAARQTKRLLNRGEVETDLVAHLDLEIELVFRALGSRDSKEAVRALMSGERPTFTGQ